MVIFLLACFLLFQIISFCWFGVPCLLINRLCRTNGNLHAASVEPNSLSYSEMVWVGGVFKWLVVLLPVYLLAFLGYGFRVSGGCVSKCRSLLSPGDRCSWSVFRLFFLRPWGVSALCSLSLSHGVRWFPEDVYHSQGDESPRRFLGSCCRYFSEVVLFKTSKDEIMGARWSSEEVCHSQGDESPRLFIGFSCRYFSEASSIKKSKDGCLPFASVARSMMIVVDGFEVEVRGQTVVVRHQHDIAGRCTYLIVLNYVLVVPSCFMLFYRYGLVSCATIM